MGKYKSSVSPISVMRFNSLIPELSVGSIKESLRFYTKVLGFQIEYERPEDRFVLVSLGRAQIMLEEINDNWKTGELERPYGRGVNLQIDVKAIQPILDSLKEHDYPVFVEPKDNWYRQGKKLLGNREFLVQDPDGYLLRFSEDIGIRFA